MLMIFAQLINVNSKPIENDIENDMVACLLLILLVPDHGKGVCADPVNGSAILGKGGPDPQGGNKEHQLSPDKGREKT
jgi:hypothetical protein